jgi:DNA polymerase delta subunit 1
MSLDLRKKNKITLDSDNEDLIFQAIDWKAGDKDISADTDSGENIKYNIQIFGKTKDGASVFVDVQGFTPHFYVEIPKKWGQFQVNCVVNAVKSRVRDDDLREGLCAYDIVERKKFLTFTNKENFRFLRLIFDRYDAMKAFRNVFYRKVRLKELSIDRFFKVFEADINPELRLIHIKKLKACGWISLPKGKYNSSNPRISTSQIDVTVKWNFLTPVECDDIAPFLIASFDIECDSISSKLFPQAIRTKRDVEKLKEHREYKKVLEMFPDHNGDPVTQIGTTFSIYGSDEIIYKHIITLKKCAPIEGVHVESYDNEKDVLLAWTKLITDTDPDMITGYNIFGFDFDFMNKRAKMCDCVRQFNQLSRIEGEHSKFIDKRLSSSAKGVNFLKYFDMTGRIVMDMYKIIGLDPSYKFMSYKLDFVAEELLQMNKNDVTPAQIFGFYKEGTPDKIKTIAEYCVQDCILPLLLIGRLNTISDKISVSNVCSVPFNYLIFRGEGIKVFSLVARQCKDEGYLIETRRVSDAEKDSKEKFKGAVVLDPQRGLHTDAVFVCDFSSLYPSCIISENMSHDCLVVGNKYDNIEGVEYKDIHYETKEGEKKSGRFAQLPEKGILPRILEKLLSERKKIRAIGKTLKDTDPFKAQIYDSMQKAMKVTCNSVYGQCGSKYSPIRCLEIAACTTATGRELLMFSKNYVEDKFGLECIYGDSVVGDTPLVVKIDGEVRVMKIKDISDTWESKTTNILLHDNSDKEYGSVDAQVWSDQGWTKIIRAIRHKTDKPIYKVITGDGIVECTEDHSLLDRNGKEITPEECILGETELLHCRPSKIYGKENMNLEDIEKLIEGFKEDYILG